MKTTNWQSLEKLLKGKKYLMFSNNPRNAKCNMK